MSVSAVVHQKIHAPAVAMNSSFSKKFK